MPTVLDIYVDESCPGCAEARRTAAEIAQAYPAITVRVFDLGNPEVSAPEAVFATPTFMLDNQLMQLGNPGPEDIIRWLGERSFMTDGEVYGGKVEQKITYLRLVDIFQDLSMAEMQEMDRTTTMSTCQKSKIFYQPQDVSEVLFILKKGRVQLYRISAEGKKLVVATIGPAQFLVKCRLWGRGCTTLLPSGGGLPVVCDEPPRCGTAHSQQAGGALRIMQVMANRLTQQRPVRGYGFQEYSARWRPACCGCKLNMATASTAILTRIWPKR